MFNLGFGVVTDNGEIDDIITLNNGDRNNILATVAGFLDNFLNKNPDSWVSFSGSTLKRTKLYHRAISINYETLVNQYKILGVLPGEFFVVETFNPTIEYKAFLIKKLTFGL